MSRWYTDFSDGITQGIWSAETTGTSSATLSGGACVLDTGTGADHVALVATPDSALAAGSHAGMAMRFKAERLSGSADANSFDLLDIVDQDSDAYGDQGARFLQKNNDDAYGVFYRDGGNDQITPAASGLTDGEVHTIRMLVKRSADGSATGRGRVYIDDELFAEVATADMDNYTEFAAFYAARFGSAIGTDVRWQFTIYEACVTIDEWPTLSTDAVGSGASVRVLPYRQDTDYSLLAGAYEAVVDMPQAGWGCLTRIRPNKFGGDENRFPDEMMFGPLRPCVEVGFTSDSWSASNISWSGVSGWNGGIRGVPWHSFHIPFSFGKWASLLGQSSGDPWVFNVVDAGVAEPEGVKFDKLHVWNYERSVNHIPATVQVQLDDDSWETLGTISDTSGSGGGSGILHEYWYDLPGDTATPVKIRLTGEDASGQLINIIGFRLLDSMGTASAEDQCWPWPQTWFHSANIGTYSIRVMPAGDASDVHGHSGSQHAFEDDDPQFGTDDFFVSELWTADGETVLDTLDTDVHGGDSIVYSQSLDCQVSSQQVGEWDTEVSEGDDIFDVAETLTFGNGRIVSDQQITQDSAIPYEFGISANLGVCAHEAMPGNNDAVVELAEVGALLCADEGMPNQVNNIAGRRVAFLHDNGWAVIYTPRGSVSVGKSESGKVYLNTPSPSGAQTDWTCNQGWAISFERGLTLTGEFEVEDTGIADAEQVQIAFEAADLSADAAKTITLGNHADSGMTNCRWDSNITVEGVDAGNKAECTNCITGTVGDHVTQTTCVAAASAEVDEAGYPLRHGNCDYATGSPVNGPVAQDMEGYPNRFSDYVVIGPHFPQWQRERELCRPLGRRTFDRIGDLERPL